MTNLVFLIEKLGFSSINWVFRSRNRGFFNHKVEKLFFFCFVFVCFCFVLFCFVLFCFVLFFFFVFVLFCFVLGFYFIFFFWSKTEFLCRKTGFFGEKLSFFFDRETGFSDLLDIKSAISVCCYL